MKSYTGLTESKILAEILPLESADMYYFRQIDIDYFPPSVESICPIPRYKDGKENFDYDIRCWSLAALLDVLHDYTLQTNTDGTVFIVCDSKKPMVSDFHNNPIEACVEMIIKLKKQNLI